MTKQVPSTDTSPGWAVGIINDIKSQLRRSGFAIGLATIGVITGYIPVALLITLRGVDPELLTRDIFASTRTPIYTGFLSNLGLFVWAAAVAIWLLGVVLLARINLRHPQLLFALGSTLCSALLLFDDAFMFHELVFPDYLGISEKKVMIMYVFLSISYVGFNVRHILRSSYLILVIAIGFLGMSVAFDRFLPMTRTETLVEDSLKFAGIVFWAVYAGTNIIQFVDNVVDRRSSI